MGPERFSLPEMAFLRHELLQKCLDSRQAAELLQVFLMGRGYGVSPQVARDAAGRVGNVRCSVESLQKELESLALLI
jgi:hypothetical protein